MQLRRLCSHRRLLGSLSAAIALSAVLASASAADAASAGPFELVSGGSLPAIQIASLQSFSWSVGAGPTSAGFGSANKGAPKSVSELTITKQVDKSSPILAQATVKGIHYKSGSLLLHGAGGDEAFCFTDIFPTGVRFSAGGIAPSESASFSYAKVSFHYGAGASCGGTPVPPVESTLVGLNRTGSKLTARVDCLTVKCRGILTVSLPSAACNGGDSKCSFTGGVRVGLGGGKTRFEKDGSAYTGGTRVGIGGAGSFSMGDGSVRVLQLSVPTPLQKWLMGHRHATLGSIIVVRGVGRAIVQRDILGAPAKIESAPGFTEEPSGGGPAGGGPTNPGLQSQSLAITECSAPVVGTPTVVSVAGTLSPARAGATVTLTYTPTSGPPPLPSPVVDQVTTTATGNFGESFDRRRNGVDYAWSVVANLPEGNGYSAATSPACSIPIP